MLERLKLLEENMSELMAFKNKFTLKDVQDDKTREWALRYGLLELILSLCLGSLVENRYHVIISI